MLYSPTFALAMLAKHWPRVVKDKTSMVLADDVGPAFGIFEPRTLTLEDAALTRQLDRGGDL